MCAALRRARSAVPSGCVRRRPRLPRPRPPRSGLPLPSRCGPGTPGVVGGGIADLPQLPGSRSRTPQPPVLGPGRQWRRPVHRPPRAWAVAADVGAAPTSYKTETRRGVPRPIPLAFLLQSDTPSPIFGGSTGERGSRARIGSRRAGAAGGRRRKSGVGRSASRASFSIPGPQRPEPNPALHVYSSTGLESGDWAAESQRLQPPLPRRRLAARR